MELDEEFIKNLGMTPAIDVHDYAIDYIKRYQQGTWKAIPTGIPLLDKHLGGGFHGGDTVVIGARPGTGKSALSTFFCRNIMYNNVGIDVIALYFNFEMSATQQMLRLFSTEINKTMSQFRNQDGGISPEMLERLEHFKELLSYANLFFVDDTSTVDDMYNRVGWVHSKYPDAQIVCFYDHTRLFGYTQERTEEEMIRRASIMFNNTCKNFGVLNIPLSQLSRKFEDDTKTKFREPTKSDLFGADALGQCAQVILLPYKPSDFGFKDVDFFIGSQKVRMDSKNIITMLLEKNRHGPAPKKIPLYSWLEFNKFREIDAEFYTELTGKPVYE